MARKSKTRQVEDPEEKEVTHKDQHRLTAKHGENIEDYIDSDGYFGMHVNTFQEYIATLKDQEKKNKDLQQQVSILESEVTKYEDMIQIMQNTYEDEIQKLQEEMDSNKKEDLPEIQTQIPAGNEEDDNALLKEQSIKYEEIIRLLHKEIEDLKKHANENKAASTPTSKDSSQSSMKKQTSRSTQWRKVQDTWFRGACYKCNKIGHRKADCKATSTPSIKLQNSFSVLNQKEDSVTTSMKNMARKDSLGSNMKTSSYGYYTCGRPGHIARNCFKKPHMDYSNYNHGGFTHSALQYTEDSLNRRIYSAVRDYMAQYNKVPAIRKKVWATKEQVARKPNLMKKLIWVEKGKAKMIDPVDLTREEATSSHVEDPVDSNPEEITSNEDPDDSNPVEAHEDPDVSNPVDANYTKDDIIVEQQEDPVEVIIYRKGDTESDIIMKNKQMERMISTKDKYISPVVTLWPSPSDDESNVEINIPEAHKAKSKIRGSRRQEKKREKGRKVRTSTTESGEEEPLL